MCLPPDDRVDLIDFKTEDGVALFLRRGKAARHGKPVLLLHGGSASSDTFLAPKGESVFDFLSADRGMDVWMLEWRGSHYITEKGSCDDVARYDIPKAIARIRQARADERTDSPISVLGHCMGAGCLAMAIGAGHVQQASRVDRVVLATVGLFYEVTWDGLTKVQDRVLERVADEDKGVLSISPDTSSKPWPAAMEETFKIWPDVWGPPWQDEFFRRLAFMFGQPFLVSNLHAAMNQAAVRKQFGAIPIKLYRHAAQNALRGFAAGFDAEGELDPSTTNAKIRSVLAQCYMNLQRFRDLDVTLVTGALNPLWHRDSIDRMGEWLSRLGKPVQKYVLEGYGHQDLWWGRTSKRDVFPLIADAVAHRARPAPPRTPQCPKTTR